MQEQSILPAKSETVAGLCFRYLQAIRAPHSHDETSMAGTRPAITLSIGVAAAQALKEKTIDGFFANGMGAELAVESGIGTLVLDIRRGDGPKPAFGFTMPAVATTERLISDKPQAAAAMIRAVVRTQKLLKGDMRLATEVGNKLFPAIEAGLIARVIERDLPFYDACISESTIAAMSQYARDVGLLQGYPTYEKIVATKFRKLWT
jgi:ABC-type nitrate/sulfonate/bicarbonate transport system substrate-binding protein